MTYFCRVGRKTLTQSVKSLCLDLQNCQTANSYSDKILQVLNIYGQLLLDLVV